MISVPITCSQEADSEDEHWVIKVDKWIHQRLNGHRPPYATTLTGLACTLFWVHHVLALSKETSGKHADKTQWFTGMPKEGYMNYGAIIKQVQSWLKRPRFAPTTNVHLKALQSL